MTWTLSAFADEAGPSLEEQISALTESGLRYVDLRTVGEHNITTLPEGDAQRVQQQLGAAGITVSMYGSPIGKIDVTDELDIDLQKLEHLGRLSRIFPCNRVRIFSFFNKKEIPREQWRQQTLDRLARLIDKARELDLVLYHENESAIFGDHPDEVAAIAELRDGQTFKLIYDFANYLRTGVSNWDTWERFRDITDCLHFKDQKRDGQHVPIGQGDTDARRIIADALQRGWTGPVTLEPHLAMSDAVLATGVHGEGSRDLSDMSPAQCFHFAAQQCASLLDELGVAWN